MSKTLRFQRPNDLSKLFGELLAAGLVPSTVDGVSPCQGDVTNITLTVPDDADEAAIAAVVAAHDPTPRAEVDPDDELVAAITAATTLAALKAALTGVNRNAAVRARVKA